MVWKKVAVLSLAALFVATLGFAADSRQNRAENTLMISATPFGLHPATLLGLIGGIPTVGGSFYLNENIQIGGDFAAYSGTQEDGDTKGTVSYSSIGGYSRIYWGSNSFNTLLSLHSRSWSGTATANTTTQVTDPGSGITTDANLVADVTIDSNALVGTLGIGNQWVMDWGLVIGLDYLVLSLPLSETSSATVDATGTVAGVTETLSGQEKADAEAAASDLGKVLNVISYFPGLFILTMGLSF